MSKDSTITQICNRISSFKIKKNEAIELLISIIENEQDLKTRIKGIEAFDDYALLNEKVFEILENLLLSDENVNIRAAASKVIIHRFLKKGEKALKWTALNEVSGVVLRELYESTDVLNKKYSVLIKRAFNIRFKKNARRYIEKGMNKYEARILSILEIFIGKEMMIATKDLSQWVYHYKIDVNGHIVGLYIEQFFEIFSPFFFKIICSLHFLEELRLPNNNIMFIPKSIKNLQSLKVLDLYMNNIRSLPNEIKDLKNLNYINLGENFFQNVPEHLCDMKSLKSIDLSSNMITYVPAFVTKLTWIEKLDLANNNIKDISDQVLSLSPLKLNKLHSQLNLDKRSKKKRNIIKYYFESKFSHYIRTPYEEINNKGAKKRKFKKNVNKTYKITKRLL